MSISHKLRHIIDSEKLNIREFSSLCGINYDSMRGYLKGRNQPSITQIKKITDLPRFKKYTAYLLSDEKTISKIRDSLGSLDAEDKVQTTAEKFMVDDIAGRHKNVNDQLELLLTSLHPDDRQQAIKHILFLISERENST